MEMWKCQTVTKQLPIPDEDSLIFWEGCRRGRLLIQCCQHCDTFRFPPSPLCARCHASQVKWQVDPGQGDVATFCVYHADIAGPAWQHDVPYTVVVVRLWHSGVYFLSQLHGIAPQAVRVGLSVQVFFEVVNTQITLPKFVPLSTAESPEYVGNTEDSLTKTGVPSIFTSPCNKA